jgi:hypothetical protein
MPTGDDKKFVVLYTSGGIVNVAGVVYQCCDPDWKS